MDETVPLVIGGQTGTGSITDDPLDVSPTVQSVTSPTSAEGNDLIYTINLSDETGQPTTYAYALGGGTANDPADYNATPTFSNNVTLSNGVLTVPEGVTSFTVTIPTIEDLLNENTETVPLVIGGATGVGAITDNDPLPTVSISSSGSVSEGDGFTVYTVTLSEVSGREVTVAYASTNGTATAGDDYTPKSGTLTFATGSTVQYITVAIIEDSLGENNEDYSITLSGQINAVLGTSTANTFIIDNDTANIASINSPTVVESGSLIYTVALTIPSAINTTFAYTLGGGTATSGVDYNASPSFSNGVTLTAGVLTVPAGVTAFTVTVATTEDTIFEPTETVPLTIGGITGTGSITDNDLSPSINAINSPTIVEGGNLIYTVGMSNASATVTTYAYTLGTGGTATSGVDYNASPSFSNGVTLTAGVLTVPAGVTAFTVTVATTEDTIFEPTETVPLTIGGITGTGSITDNDLSPSINAINSPTIVEGGNLIYTVGMSNASATVTTYAYTLGTGGTATSGVDYNASPSFSNGVTLTAGVLTVPAGVTAFTVTVATTEDTIFEPTETVPLTIGGITGTGSITDNDLSPSINAINSPTIVEGGNLIYTVGMSNASATVTTYAYTLGTGGTATSGVDYNASPSFSNGVTLTAGVLTVPAGVTAFTVTVATTEDTIFEPTETVPLTIGGITGTGSITDNDLSPSINAINSPTIVEGGNLIYTVGMSNASATVTTYAYTLGTGGTATSGVDYNASPSFSNGVTLTAGVLTVPAGVTAFTVTVATTEDTIFEPTETVPLTIGGITGTGSITDNDLSPSINAINSPTIVEGGNLIYTVGMSNASATVTTYAYTLGTGGTATSGVDYNASPSFSNGVTLTAGVLTVPAGVTAFTVTVATTEDTIFEPTETVPLTIGGITGTGSITDNDLSPSINAINSPTIVEGGNLIYTVGMSNASATVTTYAYTLGTGGTATSGVDYNASPSFSNGVTLTAGVLTVPAGVTAFTVTVATTEDTIFEPTETVPLTIGGITGTGSITDNDLSPSINAINSPTIVEGGNLIYTVGMSNASATVTTYAYTLGTGGTATSGVDYNASPSFSNGVTLTAGVLTVPAGVTAFTVTVATTEDTIFEPTETVPLTIGGITGTGSITDNDLSPSINAINSPTIVEGGNLIYTVGMSNASATVTTYAYTLGTGGTATSGVDYNASPSFSNGVTLTAGVLTVPAGVTAFTVTVATTEDTIFEPTETVPLTIGGITGTGSITDNDLSPSINAINSPTIVEGGNLIYTVGMSNASATVTTYAYTLGTGGTATSGVDYNASPSFSNGVTLTAGVLTVPAGVTAFTVTVATTEDTIFEPTETVPLTIGGITGTGSITDNDLSPSINAINSPTIVEGGNLIYTVGMSNASATVTTYAYTLGTGGTATSGVDYNASPSFSNGVTLTAGVLTVPAGVTAFTVTVATTEDTIFEPTETVPLTIGGITGTGSITDNDLSPSINAINSPTIVEGGNLIYTVGMSNASATVTTYAYTLGTGGTATSGVDYNASPSFSNGVTLTAGVLTVPAGVTAFTVTVATTEDTIFEPTETVPLTIGGITGTGSITDNDLSPSINAINSPTIVEGGNLIYTVGMSNASATVTTYAYTLGTGGTATSGVDYNASPSFSNGVTLTAGVLTVPAGVTAFTVTVATTEDTIFEPTETVPLTIGGITGTGSITDNDLSPSINAINSPTIVEGGNLIYTVGMSNASATVTTYAYTLGTGGTATSGVDYNASPSFSNGVTLTAGVLTVPAGVTAFTVTVATTEDTIFEPTETVPLTIGGITGTGSITDNDLSPSINAINSPTIVEGGNLIYTVGMSNASATVTTYAYTLGTGGTATSGVDYNASPSFSNGVTLTAGVLTVPAGVTAFTVTVATTEDTIFEPTETVPLTIGGITGTGSITDNDLSPSINAINSPTIVEGGNLIYTVGMSNASATVTTYAYTLGTGGTATSGVDYNASPSFSNGVTLTAGVLTVPAGVTAFTVTVATTEDTIFEPTETVPLTIGGITGTGSITDNDLSPTVNITGPANVNEGAGSAVYTITLSAASGFNTTVNYATGSGTATSGSDFTAKSGTLTFAAGVTQQFVTVTIIDDAVAETTENYTVTLASPTNATLGTSSVSTNIIDNDSPNIASINSPTVVESGSLIYTVALTIPSAINTTFAYTLGGGTATSGVDYNASPSFSNGVTLTAGVLTVPAGVTAFTVTVATTEDTIFEPTETVPLTIGGITGTGSITDNDLSPSINAINSPTIVEGGNLIYTVGMSNASATVTTYAYTLGTGGTATSGVDYNASPSFSNGVTLTAGVLTVPAGVTAFTVTVATTEDTIFEPTETVPLTIGGITGTGSITDNDLSPSINAINSPTIVEGGNLIYTVGMSNASATVTTYAYTLGTGGTATSGVDYNASPSFSNGVTLTAGVLTVPAGVTAFTVTVATTEDTIFEPTETVPLTIGGITGTGSITDNDLSPSINAINSPTIVEGGNLIYTVGMSNASATVTTYAYTLGTGGTATSGVDYNASPSFSNGVTLTAGVLTVPAGVTAFTVTVATTEDTIFEPTETVPLTIGGITGTGSITDNDLSPTVNITGPANVNEGAGSAVYTITLSAASGFNTTVNYATGSGTATSGSDFTAKSGTLTFAAGVTQQFVTVTIIDDAVAETTENYTVTLASPTNATLGTSSVSTNIIDNDQPPVIDLDANNSTAAGNNYAGTFTENFAAVNIADTDISITDPDSTNIIGATITLTNRQASDFLATGTLPGGIGANIVNNAGSIVVTLSGTTTLANYQTAIRNITFNNTSDTPNTTPRNITIQVTDGTSASNTAISTITVVPTNDAPIGVADNVVAVEGTTTLRTTVLANDTDPESNPLTVSMFATNTSGLNTLAANGTNTITTALGGTVVMNANGTYTYTAPERNHADTTPDVDSFAYKANDGSLNSAWTVVNITITDTGPIANNDVDSVGIGNSVTGNVITGEGGITADTLNVDGPFNLNNVTLTTGTLISNTLNGTTNVRTIVTSNGTLAIDLDDGSYTYTAGVTPKVVTNPTGVGSFTSQGISLFGFEGASPFTGTNLNLAQLTGANGTTNAGRVRFNTAAGNGVGVDDTAGAGNPSDSIQNGEELVIQLGVTSKSVSVALTDLGAGEQAVWQTFNAAGTLISSGTTAGVASGSTNINISSGTAISYVLVRSTANATIFKVDGITIIPEPSGASDVFTYTLADSDGSTSNATLTMNYDSTTTAFNDTAVVYEAGINQNGAQHAGTLQEQSIERATGNILANDTGVSSFTQIVNVNGTAPDGNGVINITDARGTVQFYTQDFNGFVKGDYVINLTGKTTEGVNDTLSFNYQLQNSVSGQVNNASLTVNIVDDAPIVENSIFEIGALPTTDFQLFFMLDVSGSMTAANSSGDQRLNNPDGSATVVSSTAGANSRFDAAHGTSTLAQMRDAIKALVSQYFDEATNVSVKFGVFSSGAKYDNVSYTTKASALAAIDALTDLTGGTNYSAGLTALQGMIGTVANPNDGVQRVSYFVTDGVPTVGGSGQVNGTGPNITSDSTNPGGTSGFTAFATNNNIQSYGVGIGAAVPTTTALNTIHNIDADGSDVKGGAANNGKDNALVISDLSKLAQALASTVPASFGGNIGGVGAAAVRLGADGGYTQYIDVLLDSADPGTTPDTLVRFTYNVTTGQITNNNNAIAGGTVSSDTITLSGTKGFTQGTLVFNFATGDYLYYPQGTTAVGDEIKIAFQVVDGDGDTAGGTTTIRIVDGKPVAVSDFDTLTPSTLGATAKFFDGNVLTAVGTDGGGAQISGFRTGTSGEDKLIDGADVTSIVFKGTTYNLTVASSGTANGGNYTINAQGELKWTSIAEPANILVFQRDGYYKYTPPAAQTADLAQGAVVSVNLANNATDATNKFVSLGGYTKTANLNNAPNATISYGTTGAGVNGGTTSGGRQTIDQLENMSVVFSAAQYARGVQNVTLTFNATDSLLGNNNNGGIGSMRLSIFDIAGNLLGQEVVTDDTVTYIVPKQYANIGSIFIQANSSTVGGTGSVAGVAVLQTLTFNPISAPAITVVAPDEVIQYTITDKDTLTAPDSSTATLTLHVVTNEFAGTAGADTLSGTASNDLISGLAGNDSISGLAGNDIIRGGDGNDTIDGGADDDQLYGGDGDDSILGGTGNDYLYGEAGNDTLLGGDGKDTIYGGAGADSIVGGLGDDLILGGAGNDTLTGGAGSDTFKWELADRGPKGSPAKDTITDFDVAPASSGGDVLDLRDLLTGENHDVGVGNLEGYLHFEKVGANTIVHINNVGEYSTGFNAAKDVQTITLTNVDLVTGFNNDQAIIQDLLTKQKLITD